MAYFEQAQYDPYYYQLQPPLQLRHVQHQHQYQTKQSLQSSSDPTPAAHYICLYPSCLGQHKRLADLERHISIVHYREFHTLYDCEYEGECRRKGELGFTRKDKMIEHMRDVHKCDIPKRPKRQTPS